MKDISLGEALRFVFPGVAFYVYLYLLFPAEASHFAATAGAIGFPLVLVVIGSGVYFIYRPLLYDPLIERLITKCTMTVRRELMNRYEIGFHDAMDLFVSIRDKYLANRYPGRAPIDSAGIHMTYQAGILALAMAVLGLIYSHTVQGLFLSALGLVALASGFVNDLRYERRERNILMDSVKWEDVDALAKTLGYAKRT